MEEKKVYKRNWKKLAPVYLIIALVLYGGIYFFLNAKKNSPSSTQNKITNVAVNTTANTVSQSSPAPTIVATNSANTAADAESAKKDVQYFYHEWFANGYKLSGSERETYIDSFVPKGYLTTKAAEQIKAQNTDVISCSQNPLPIDEYRFSTPVITNNNATMKISATYNPPPFELVFNTDLIKSNGHWAINTFHCPPPSSP